MNKNQENIIADLKEIKKQKSLTNQKISDETGIPKGTVDRVFGSKLYNFEYDTITKLSDYIIGQDVYDKSKPNPLPDTHLIEYMERIISIKDEHIKHTEQNFEHQLELMQCQYEKQIEVLRKEKQIFRIITLLLSFVCFVLAVIDVLNSSVGWFR